MTEPRATTQCLWCGQEQPYRPNASFMCFCCDECEDAYQVQFEAEDRKNNIKRVPKEDRDY